jgi:hypothetical protein
LWVLLVVVVIEAYVISRLLKKTFKDSFGDVLYINIITTLIGFVLQGIIRLALLMTLSDGESEILNILLGNLGTIENNFTVDKIIELAIGLSFGFVISFYFEWKFLMRFISIKYTKIEVRNAVIWANLASYIFLFFYVLTVFWIKK